MRKGQTESYSFLIGILITVFLMGIVVWGAYSILFSTDTEESYESLKKRFEGLAVKPEGSLPFFVDKYRALIGFDRDVEALQFSAADNCPGFNSIAETIQKPKKKECKGKACLCLCTINIHLLYGSSLTKAACENSPCFTLHNIDRVIGGSTCSRPFIPGITSQTDTSERGVQTVFYKKIDSTLSIDTREPLTLSAWESKKTREFKGPSAL